MCLILTAVVLSDMIKDCGDHYMPAQSCSAGCNTESNYSLCYCDGADRRFNDTVNQPLVESLAIVLKNKLPVALCGTVGRAGIPYTVQRLLLWPWFNSTGGPMLHVIPICLPISK